MYHSQSTPQSTPLSRTAGQFHDVLLVPYKAPKLRSYGERKHFFGASADHNQPLNPSPSVTSNLSAGSTGPTGPGASTLLPPPQSLNPTSSVATLTSEFGAGGSVAGSVVSTSGRPRRSHSETKMNIPLIAKTYLTEGKASPHLFRCR